MVEQQSYGVFTPQQDNKRNVEPVHSYDAFHTRSDKPGVKGLSNIIISRGLCMENIKSGKPRCWVAENEVAVYKLT